MRIINKYIGLHEYIMIFGKPKVKYIILHKYSLTLNKYLFLDFG